MINIVGINRAEKFKYFLLHVCNVIEADSTCLKVYIYVIHIYLAYIIGYA